MNSALKTAIVTGANRGIGLALTQKLLAEGYRVVGTPRGPARYNPS
ncbi:SDR family NAD(P)-dependent oxidoreductase [Hymenobacter coccineus]|nr:SDR family NAD(P)-dependent oxidoreductase [Hymenobacter coccineus]